jgi:hypothetical protein
VQKLLFYTPSNQQQNREESYNIPTIWLNQDRDTESIPIAIGTT